MGDFKTTVFEGKEYYLVPKTEGDDANPEDSVKIELSMIREKTIVYVKTENMWGEEYTKRLKKNIPDHSMTYQREEWDDKTYRWMGTFGGYWEANKEDSLRLESWYQKYLNEL